MSSSKVILSCPTSTMSGRAEVIVVIIESVDSISKDERGLPLTQYITIGRISRGGYTFNAFETPPSCSTADFLQDGCITSP